MLQTYFCSACGTHLDTEVKKGQNEEDVNDSVNKLYQRHMRNCEDASLHLCRENSPVVMYVTAYSIGCMYGGPEEGGWYYDVGTPIAAVPIQATYRAVHNQLNEVGVEPVPNDAGEHSRICASINNLFGTRDVMICTERTWPMDFPRRTPRYE